MQEIPSTDGKPPIMTTETTPIQTDNTQIADTNKPAMSAAMFPEPPVSEKRAVKVRWKAPLWLLICAALLIGLFAGVAIMHQRAVGRSIIVSVNGTKITEDELLAQVQATAGVQAIHKMVQDELQLQFAQKKGLAPTDAEVDAEYAKISLRPNFKQAMAQSGIGEADIKHSLRVQMAETAVISQGVTVTDADLQKYYQAQSDPNNPHAQFYRPQAVSLRAIATATQPQAQRALTELAAQTPFELVATTYSVDTSKSNGGLLAPLALDRSPLHRSPALEKTIFNMKVGDQIGPVFFANQWWIFRCQDKAPATTIPYAQVHDECLNSVKILKGSAANSKRIQQEFADFQHTSTLQAFWPQYQKVIAVH